MVKVKGAALVAAAAVAIVVGAGAAAWAQTPAQAITERQNLMKTNGGAAQQLNPIVRGQAPWNQQTAIAQAQALSAGASRMPALFPAGTAQGQGAGTTRAAPAIWSNASGFQAEIAKFGQEGARLVQLAQNNDEAGFKEQFPKVAAVCGSCHTAFRAPQ